MTFGGIWWQLSPGTDQPYSDSDSDTPGSPDLDLANKSLHEEDDDDTPTSGELHKLEAEIKRLSKHMGEEEVKRRNSERAPSSSGKISDSGALCRVSVESDPSHQDKQAKRSFGGDDEKCNLCTVS